MSITTEDRVDSTEVPFSADELVLALMAEAVREAYLGMTEFESPLSDEYRKEGAPHYTPLIVRAGVVLGHAIGTFMQAADEEGLSPAEALSALEEVTGGIAVLHETVHTLSSDVEDD